MIPECCNPAIYCSLECAQADQPKPKQVEEKDHIVDFVGLDDNGQNFLVDCSCGAKWTVGRYQTGSGDRVQESIRSHHISVGLKPTGVL